MNPFDEIHGVQPRRFLQLVCEFEIEVTDPTQAAAYTMDWGHDESGEPVMMTRSNQNRQMAEAAERLIIDALNTQGAKAGFKLTGSQGIRPREVGDDGRYVEMTLPSLPARNDDGGTDAST